MNVLETCRAEEILGAFEGRRILVLGDAMLDRYIWGEAVRISPEAPVPIVEMGDETHRLGGAANVARNIAALGGSAVLVALRGDDADGERLAGELSAAGLETGGLVTDPGRPTTLKTRLLARKQQVVRADRESRREIRDGILESVLAKALDLSTDAEGVVISDYGKGVITAVLLDRLLPAWRDRGLTVCVDPKETHFMSYRGVTTITPNVAEAGFAYGRRVRDLQSLEEVGLGLLRHLEAASVLVTRGEEGMSLFERGDRVSHFPTVGTEVFDVTGAGDTVVAAFTIAVASGARLAEAAILSNHAAGRVIREVGTWTVSRDEIRRSLRNSSEAGGGAR
jgi:D-beta-D-heptose 7-phosphate kinase/D-beta-D-heptose 1-phosphate adenosyltransferase